MPPLVDDLTQEVLLSIPSEAPQIFGSRMKIRHAQEPSEMKNDHKSPLHEFPCISNLPNNRAANLIIFLEKTPTQPY